MRLQCSEVYVCAQQFRTRLLAKNLPKPGGIADYNKALKMAIDVLLRAVRVSALQSLNVAHEQS